jgi:hypothetical protein
MRISGHINNAVWLRTWSSVKFKVQPIK